MRSTRGGQPLTASCLLVVVGFLLIVNSVLADELHKPRIISKRQAGKPAANGAQSTAMAMSSVQMTSGGGGGGGGSLSNAKPPANEPSMEFASAGGGVPDQEPEGAGAGRRPASRRPRPQVARKRPRPGRYDDDDDDQDGSDRRHDYHDEDGDCYDDDDEAGHKANLFHTMAARPMRQMTRMMGDMFDQMQGMSSDIMFNRRRGGNFVSAGASSSSYEGGDEDGDGDDDGYSRTSSIVNNNGRTRGIISETRNGRTKTQRIGDD